MDYTLSPDHTIHPGTGNRMHSQNQAVPTVVSDKDLNSLAWSLMELVKAAGLPAQQFDPAAPATYQVVRNAIAELGRRGYGFVGQAAGTADAITVALSPAPLALVDGMTVRVRASAANATATPTFAVSGLAAKVIVKGGNTPLEPGSIAGAGHWLELQFDALLDKWVLSNPLNVATLPAGTEIQFGGTAAPAGFIKLNGAVPLVTSVPALVTNVYCGDANNATAAYYYRCTDPLNPSTTRSTTGAYFALKNARGRFSRGLSDGDPIDSGRSLWAYQSDAMQNITGSFGVIDGGNVFFNGAFSGLSAPYNKISAGVAAGSGGVDFDASRVVRTAAETRGTNYPSLVCVKI